ncbi:MmcQ/YjbR family DNA-binding protein [Mucilaginibacter litoreus]|uniref:MmcQ/YjbR family DNA-binding protein n=1 Tax=Mucilaginibacter litoreus TaxID=1048221 RepID=A0ABW3AR39_9SPHI
MENQTFVHLQFLRNTLLSLPGVTEKKAYGTPAFYAGKKIFCRLQDDWNTLVLANNTREELLQTQPETFFITDHYLNYDYVLVNMTSVEPAQLKQLLLEAWKLRANKSLIKQLETTVND